MSVVQISLNNAKKYKLTVVQISTCGTNMSKHNKEITRMVPPPLSCPVCGSVDTWRKPKLARYSHLASCEAK